MQKIFTLSLVILVIAPRGLLCDQTTIPSVEYASASLHQVLNRQRQLIAHVDNQGLFNKMSRCYEEINLLEAQCGVLWREPHSVALRMLCGACDHQKSTLVAQLQKIDSQRAINPEIRCKLHRLYTQAASYALQLETLLQPYKQELKKISDTIHQLRPMIQEHGNKQKPLSYGMLFT